MCPSFHCSESCSQLSIHRQSRPARSLLTEHGCRNLSGYWPTDVQLHAKSYHVDAAYSFKVPVDDAVPVQVFQSCHRVYELYVQAQQGRIFDIFELLTRCRRLYSGWILVKCMISPFSIHSDMIEKSGGASVTPINGKMFSC